MAIKYTKFRPGESADITLTGGDAAAIGEGADGVAVGEREEINLRFLESRRGDDARAVIIIESSGGNCSFSVGFNRNNEVSISNRAGDVRARVAMFAQNRPDTLRAPVGTVVQRANGRQIRL